MGQKGTPKVSNNQKGFTLLELLVVVVIVGILTAIAVPRIGNLTQNAERSAVEANLRTIDSAIMMYRSETGSYPDSLDVLKDYLQDVPTGPGNAVYGITGDKEYPEYRGYVWASEGEELVVGGGRFARDGNTGYFLPIDWEADAEGHVNIIEDIS